MACLSIREWEPFSVRLQVVKILSLLDHMNERAWLISIKFISKATSIWPGGHAILTIDMKTEDLPGVKKSR